MKVTLKRPIVYSFFVVVLTLLVLVLVYWAFWETAFGFIVHGFTGVFLSGLSYWKSFILLVYLAFFFVLDYLVFVNLSRKVFVKSVGLLAVVLGAFSSLSLLGLLHSLRIPLNVTVGFYSLEGDFEFLLNSVHSHMAKPIAGAPFLVAAEKLGFNVSEVGVGFELISLYGAWIYAAAGVLFYLLCICVVICGLYLFRTFGVGVFGKLTYIVLSFVLLKSVIDGGLFSYEFLTSIAFLCVWIQHYVSKSSSLLATGIFVVILEMVLALVLAPKDYYFALIIIPANIAFFAMLFLVVGKIKFSYVGALGLLTFSFVLSSFVFNTRPEVFKNTDYFAFMPENTEVQFRTKAFYPENDNLKILNENLNLREYVYTSPVKQRVSQGMQKFGLNPYMYKSYSTSYCDSSVEEVVVGRLVSLKSRNMPAFNNSRESYWGQAVLEINETEKLGHYSVFFVHNACESLLWELLNNMLYEAGFEEFVFYY